MSINNEIKKGSMRQVMVNVRNILRSDDELMRLLAYLPENLYTGENIVNKDSNGEVIDSDEYWEIVDDHIFMGEMNTKIEEVQVCRLFIYPGRRRPVHRSYILAKQEIYIDIVVPEAYSEDLRMEWIIDRINELLALEHVEGSIGKMDFAQGNGWVTSIGHEKYQLSFVFGANKK
ncbi:hypothetical protein ABE073_03940 [Lederbergia citrisecunda]|uniref:hypothetical protein n=1 Tax=Lederbergia citrisecunda TaxID=2833583 RepID=UPI003D2BDBFF